MRARRQASLSLAALLAHKVRTALALASVGVGVTAVLLTSAAGAGAEREVVARIEAMGTNLLIVRPAQVKRLVGRAAVRGAATSLVPADSDEIACLGEVSEAAPAAEFAAKVKAARVATVATVRGTTPAYRAVRRLTLRAGRFFDATDDLAARRVAVLGARVAATLFPAQDAVGRDIRVRGVPFEVIGVLPPRGVLADGSDEDGQVLVPIRAAMRRLMNVTWLSGIFVSARSEDAARPATSAIVALLASRHRFTGAAGGPDFEVQDGARYLQMQRQTASSLSGLSAGLGILALGVGGAGILGLMLMTVRERTAEIGLRMAVGARPRDVFVQFALEAILLALAGWAAGLAAGAAGSTVVALATGWPVAVPSRALLASFAMSVLVGVGAGAFPARRASRVPPIQALLTE
jgi:putative ABC transport system permease protein